jgi:hypothetical protein
MIVASDPSQLVESSENAPSPCSISTVYFVISAPLLVGALQSNTTPVPLFVVDRAAAGSGGIACKNKTEEEGSE